MQEKWGWMWLERFVQDLRYAVRTLSKAPGFTLASVTVLALGIGATTALFSLLDAALLRPLPFASSDRLVMLWERAPKFERSRVAPLNLLDWTEHNHAFVSMAGVAGSGPTPLNEATGTAETVVAQSVTATFFDVLGIVLLAGRTFVADDATQASPVAVVSEHLWRRRFGGVPDVVGRRITLAGGPVTIIGVVPADFQFVAHCDLWTVLPLTRTPDQRRLHYLQVRPDERENALEIYVPAAQNPWYSATVVVQTTGNPTTLVPSIAAAITHADRAIPVTRVRTMDDVAAESTARPRFRAQLVGTFAAVAVVLAGLGIFSVLTFMVHQRRREFSIRMALGAQSADVLRLVLGNGVKLIAIGLVIGVAAAALLTRSLASLLFAVKPLDPIAFMAATAILGSIALVACAGPAIRAARSDPAVALREE